MFKRTGSWKYLVELDGEIISVLVEKIGTITKTQWRSSKLLKNKRVICTRYWFCFEKRNIRECLFKYWSVCRNGAGSNNIRIWDHLFKKRWQTWHKMSLETMATECWIYISSKLSLWFEELKKSFCEVYKQENWSQS